MKNLKRISKTIKNLTVQVINAINITGDMKLFSYAGSKTKFKKQFHHILSKIGVKKVGTYIEAFAGSLESMWHIMEVVNADKIVINDLNKRMINLYIQIQKNPTLVFTMLEKLEDKFQSMILDEIPTKGFVPKELRDIFDDNRKMYNYIRDDFNNHILDETNAAEMLFLLNHNFNGLYNENKKGGFNIAFNWKAKKLPMTTIKTNLFNLSKFFNKNNVVFESLDIDELVSKYNDHDTMIYLDPPYIDTKIQYLQNRVGTKKKPSKNSFYDVETHIKLLDSCKKYKYVMYSNNNHSKFKKILNGYVNFSRTGTISSKKSKKSKEEILGYIINEAISTISNEIPELKIESNTKVLSTTISNNIITTGSICSGGGASEESLKQLGFNNKNHKNLFMCEWDDKVSKVYKDNFKSENYFKDFYKTNWEKVENQKLDILFVSTPCTEFSMASGQRKGLDSEVGMLYIDALIQARKMNVDRIISENVSSIISSGKHWSKIKKDDGSILELNYIPNKKQLEKENWILLESEKDKYIYTSKFNKKLKIGRTLKVVEDILINDFPDYNVYMEVLNTKDFNTPQNRSRFFLVMIKKDKDLGFRFPKKQPLQTKMIDLLEKIVDNSLTITNRDIIVYSKKEYNNPKQLNLYGEMKNVSGKISTHRSSKIIVNPIISPCLTTKGHTTIFHKNIVRNLSPTEQKRLHGFSENYKLPIDNYKLSSHIMGNTLSPVVMKELIKGVLFMDEYNTKSNNTDYLPTTKKLVA